MSSAIRNFIVMFLLFLLIFGICGHFIATKLIPGLIEGNDTPFQDDSTATSSTDESAEEFLSSDLSAEDELIGNSKSVAFLCLDKNKELVSIFVIHTNDGYKTSVSSTITGNSTTEINGASLAELYRLNGADYIINKLQYLVGFKINDHATLYSIDVEGKGHTISELSVYLGYRYRLNESFQYPNPYYKEPEQNEESYDSVLSGEESVESMEESTASGESIDSDNPEFITIEPNSYALNGITNGIKNSEILLDSEWNPNAYMIFQDLFKRMLEDNSIKSDKAKQAAIFNYFEEKTFSDFNDLEVSEYLFEYANEHFECDCEKISDWDDVKDTFIAKIKGDTK